MAMVKRLSNIGNSLGIIFDKPVLELLKINKETDLNISTDGKRLIIEPLSLLEHKKRVSKSLKKIIKNHHETFRKLAK